MDASPSGTPSTSSISSSSNSETTRRLSITATSSRTTSAVEPLASTRTPRRTVRSSATGARCRSRSTAVRRRGDARRGLCRPAGILELESAAAARELELPEASPVLEPAAQRDPDPGQETVGGVVSRRRRTAGSRAESRSRRARLSSGLGLSLTSRSSCPFRLTRRRAGTRRSRRRDRRAPAGRTAGGRSGTNRCFIISRSIFSTYGWPKRVPSPPPITTASRSRRLTVGRDAGAERLDGARRSACARACRRGRARAPRCRSSAAARPCFSIRSNRSVFVPLATARLRAGAPSRLGRRRPRGSHGGRTRTFALRA